MTKIFTNATTNDEKVKSIMNYYSVTGDSKYKIDSRTQASKIIDLYNDIQDLQQYVYTYYEYVQFKRGKFECTNVKYDEKSGRIIKMDFKFTGKFQ